MTAYGQVAVDIAARGTDRLYTYLVPERLRGSLVPGTWVRVPFGARRVTGLYLGPTAEPPAGVQVKEIGSVVADLPPLPPNLLKLARWLSDYYLCTFVSALRLLLPAQARRQQVRVLRLQGYRLQGQPDLNHFARAPLQRAALEALGAAGGQALTTDLVRQLGPGVRGALRALAEKGVVVAYEQEVRRSPFARPAKPEAPPPLTSRQRQVLAGLSKALQAAWAGENRPALLFGVTGSGKTEVYLNLIRETLAAGRQAIVLVPEISLTPQMVGRFRSRFGTQVAVLHSALSEGERFDEWRRIRAGQVGVVIGARSAIFAPFANVGLIVIDEEHEASYKQEENPRYHARTVAEARARFEGALLVLGSATPAVESFHRAEGGSYQLFTLPERVKARPLPQVELVDMRAELRALNKSIFSQRLTEALTAVLERGEQALLFLNRRGFATFILCRSCGEALGCPHCSVTLTYHLGAQLATCHYCGYQLRVPKRCPSCQSEKIRHFGAGTERVQLELQRLFPGVRSLRMDVDTTRRKGSHGAILGAFSRGEAQVLIGTQMIAKGLDFPRVTLVGVISADTSLNLPDFRAAERTFQLVTQVAGRAGRAELPGQVVVQSYRPDHFALGAASRHAYREFYDQELQFRETLAYPPFAELVYLLFSGEDFGAVEQAAKGLAARLRPLLAAGELLGPSPAPLAKLRGIHRHQLLLRGQRRAPLLAALRQALTASGWQVPQGVRLSIDVEPLNML